MFRDVLCFLSTGHSWTLLKVHSWTLAEGFCHATLALFPRFPPPSSQRAFVVPPVCNRDSRTHTHTLTHANTHTHSCCEELIVWYSVTDLNYSIWYFLQRIWFSSILTLKNIPPNCWPILPHPRLFASEVLKQKSIGLKNKHVSHKHFTFCWWVFEWRKTIG